MIGDIRVNIEMERAKNCIFTSVLRTRNERKRGSTVIDGKFAKFLCHTEPTMTSAMTVYKYRRDTIADSTHFLEQPRTLALSSGL